MLFDYEHYYYIFLIILVSTFSLTEFSSEPVFQMDLSELHNPETLWESPVSELRFKASDYS